MKSFVQGVIVLFFIFITSHVYSQEEKYVEVSDFESWSSVELGYKLNKKWSFGLQEQLRLDNNSTELKGYFTQLTADYKLFKKFELGTGLRYTTKNDNEGKVQGNRNYLRYHFDASYKHKVSDFSLKYRFRYQNSNEIDVSVSDRDFPIQFFRLEANVDYNIKGWKLDPEFSGELFDYMEQGVNYGLVGYRLTLGTSFEIHKNGKLGVYYRIQEELNTDYPQTNYILRLKYSYTIKNKK